jgi:hypothetical protein
MAVGPTHNVGMGSNATDVRLRIAYEEGLRALDYQRHALAELRSRTVALMTVLAIAVTSLGGVALRDGRNLRVGTYVALALFALAVMLLSAVLFPRSLTFANDAKMLVDVWRDEMDLSLDETYRHLAAYSAENSLANERSLMKLNGLYAAAAVVTGACVLALLLDLSGRS